MMGSSGGEGCLGLKNRRKVALVVRVRKKGKQFYSFEKKKKTNKLTKVSDFFFFLFFLQVTVSSDSQLYSVQGTSLPLSARVCSPPPSERGFYPISSSNLFSSVLSYW